ncbi:PREDICTED: NEDD4-binding protein 1-like [Wasmannia auropunctata]|uniref:NEDD4-binding protein 1-like n=1 Tax=Wasmannia auropunctata TaxID=64793 RepID=UPI0005EDA2ED|nr:PREDICTED: NEDD4-binding protein 1-like [Wasmannia auropunctata]XP_011700689.1 PREDICTED: NEDD4-binding protein 1-like [Wasmannia auropunctata]
MNVAQSTRMKRKRSIERESPYCYESPLRGFKKSLEELRTIVGNVVYNKNERLTCDRRKLSKQDATGSSGRKTSSRNSVIVINDSETDDGNDDDNNDETNDGDKGDASISIIECSSKSASPAQRRKRVKVSNEQMKKSSTISLDSDLSVLSILSDWSDSQESILDGENIAPLQTEDDVVELWSCLKNSPKAKKGKKSAKSDTREKKDVRSNYFAINKKRPYETNILFRIDRRPNFKYLKRLTENTKQNAQKKLTKQGLFQNRIAAKSFVKPVEQSPLNRLDRSQRKRRHNNNLDSNPTELHKAHCSNELQGEAERTNSDLNSSTTNSKHKLREIIVDGCNVAMAHTNGKEFSEKGIKIVVNFFTKRGHVVKVFLPQHVRRKEHTFLEQLYKEGTVVFTPSRKIGGRQITSYDDRFILKYATSCGGIVISSDQYRDLYREKPEWRNTILNRLLTPTFVGDYIMFPEDPLGKFGPNLERFLRH